MAEISLLDSALLDAASLAAQTSPRRRKNHNFHAAESDTCHRLLNAIEPQSYVQPHRHIEPTKDETLVVIRGKLGLIVFDHAGAIVSAHLLAPASANVGVNVAHGTWHSVVALEPGTIFFEAKAGPYCALTADERAEWAPAEGTPEAQAQLTCWRALFT